ncbi:MAG: hypothetical protein K9J21_12555 [Bacteroidales bacterium]|nr:hypothetical protein [Bacteroidales bacterium]
MKNIYNAYFKIRELKLNLKARQSEERKKGNIEIAYEYGDRVTVVDECLSILSEECNLKFEQ